MAYKVEASASIRIDVDLGDGFIIDNKVGTRIWATTLTGRIDANGDSHLTGRGDALTINGARGKRPAVVHAVRLEDLPPNLRDQIERSFDRAVYGLAAGAGLVGA